MRIGTLFSGIGAPEQALKRLYPDNHEIVFACEWDKFARQSCLANYEIEEKHFHKDINDMDGTQYRGKVDIIIGGSPCQDFSIAGLRAGIEGHRGKLIWQYYRIIKEIMPPVFIYENVKGMVSDKGGKTLKDFLEVFRDLGYGCHAEVINTKDYGVPQNRERIYIVGFLDDAQYFNFKYAYRHPLKKRLKDVLEDNVDEKYYLSEKAIIGLDNHHKKHKEKGNGFGATITDAQGVSNCISARYFKDGSECLIKIEEPKIYQKGRGYNKGGEKDICPTLTINSFEHNNHVLEPIIYDDYNGKIKNDGVACTLTLNCGASAERNGQKVILPIDKNGYRIRKLTPRECLRLQDFSEDFIQVVSDSQMYKQAGNSMSVNVLEMIFKQIEKSKHKQEDSLF